MEAEDVEKLTQWSKPREVNTKRGPRILRKAECTEAFSEMWKTRREELRALGAGYGKTLSGEWELTWWQEIAPEETARRAEAQAASRATDVALNFPSPAGLEYLPFQKAGIAYALKRRSTLIADEMGLGKTIQALGVVNADPSIEKVLVICPATLKGNWRREAKKWLVRQNEYHVDVAESNRLPYSEFLVINYDILHKHNQSLVARGYDLVVLDECHYVKNPKARRSKMAYEIAAAAKRSLWMSGTPIVNRPKELLPILEAIGGGVMQRVGTGWRYLKRYCGAVNNGFGWDFSGATHLDELQGILREECMIRRLKKDVLTELPAKRRQVIEIEVEGGRVAKAIAAEQAAWKAKEGRLADLRGEMALAKAADDEDGYKAAVAELKEAARASFAEISRLRHQTAVEKIPYAIEQLEEAIESSGKVVCFAHHHDVVNAVRDHFGEKCVVLTGETKQADRQAAVDRFQNNAECVLFIGSITAAGVGITLTASSHVVFLELDWVPGNITQAEDRCHRIGQRDSVLIQHLVLAESLDAQMAKTLVEKQEVIDRALDREREELAEEPIIPGDRVEARKNGKAGTTIALTVEEVAKVHAQLKYLASRCDFAEQLDGQGFNRLDARIGHSLAEARSLSLKQAELGARVVAKYKRQLQSAGLVVE